MSYRISMARGGHHFVKMVTAVTPKQLMRSVIGCLCMTNHFAKSAPRVCWKSPGSSPQPRMFVWTEGILLRLLFQSQLLPAWWLEHVIAACDMLLVACHWVPH